MSFEIVEKNTVLREITVTVAGDAVKRIEGKLVENARKNLKMPGFRAGKVPASIIRQRAGLSIMEDARREALQVSVREAIDGIENLVHVGEAEILVPKAEDGGFVAKINVEITPVIELKDYKGVEVEIGDVQISDADVDAEIEKMRERHAVVKPVADDATVCEGNLLMATLSDPNEAASKFCSAGTRHINVGKGYFNADMEKALIGAKRGEPTRVTAMVEDQEAAVTVTVDEIRERILPELNDEFALDTGVADTLDALKVSVRERLVKEAEDQRKEKIADIILAELRKRMTTDMPEGYIKARATQAIRLQIEQMMRQQLDEDMVNRIANNIKPEELEEYRNDYHNEIILNAIAKAEAIEVSEDAILEEARKWFQHMDDTKIKHWLKSNNAASFVGEQVKRDRAIDLLRETAVIKAI